MTVRIVEWQLPYTAWDGIEITANKVIKLLLRQEDNLIMLNDENEIYTDLQLADWILPTDEFPVWVTVGRVNSADGWYMSWTMLNFKTTSWDYGRWIYGTDWHIYYDMWTGTWQQVYTWPEVDALFAQLRSELSTVAFTWDYNDLSNRPVIPVMWDGILTITQNGVSKWTFTANQIANWTIDVVDTTYPSMTAWELGTWTDTTNRVVSAKVIADYVSWKITNVYKYKWSVADYDHLPTTDLTVGDVYNVEAAHTTAPKFDAWTNVAWNWTSRDPLAWSVDLSWYQEKLTAWANITLNWNTISATDTTYNTATSSVAWLVKLWSDTAQTETANAVSSTASRTYAVQLNSSDQMVVNVPRTDTTVSSATSSVSWTIKLASDTPQTEAAQAVSSTANRTYWVQVNASGQAVVNVPRTDTTANDATISITQWWAAMWDFTTNQWTAETISLQWNILATQNTYDGLPSSKNTDWNFYFIYSA